jgi:hypothetical protein
MHPWIAGRIVETMQHDSRARSDHARLARTAVAPRPLGAHDAEPREPYRARVGFALARVGLRIAGARDPAIARVVTATPATDPNHWSNPWTTCGATSTSGR